jgi:hypothetical protein
MTDGSIMTSQNWTTAGRSTSEMSTTRTRAQWAALVTGIVFLAVGVAGFVPGLTQNLDDIEFAGHESGAELLGIFQVSILHNLVHLAFGAVGVAAAARHSASRTFLIGGGIVYLVLFVYGLLVDNDHDANFVPLNGADDVLHLLLGAGMIGLGLLFADQRAADSRPGQQARRR